jgi:hypothetical protein
MGAQLGRSEILQRPVPAQGQIVQRQRLKLLDRILRLHAENFADGGYTYSTILSERVIAVCALPGQVTGEQYGGYA